MGGTGVSSDAAQQNVFVFLISFISELVYLYLDLFPCNIPIVIYSYVPYELAGNLLHTLLPQTTM